MSDLGKLIRETRKEKGLGLRELARKIDISHSYLSQIENGNKLKPKSYILKVIAQELDLSYRSLLKHAGYETNMYYLDEFNELKVAKSPQHLKKQSIENFDLDIDTPIYLDEYNEGKFYFFNDEGAIDETKQKKIRDIIKTILN